MADEQHRAAAFRDLRHLSQTLFLELGVADREHLVDDQNFGFQMRRDRKRQPHIHARGESLDRRIEKLLHVGEGDDLIEPPFDLGAPHAEDGAVEIDVFAAGQFGMKPGADFEHAGDPADELDASLVGFGDAADHLEQRRFAGAVAADDADDFAALDLEGNVLERPKILGGRRRAARLAAKHVAKTVGDDVAQSDIAFAALMADAVFLTEIVHSDGDVGHAEIQYLSR